MEITTTLLVAALVGIIQLVLLFSIIRTATACKEIAKNTAQTNKLLDEISKKLDNK